MWRFQLWLAQEQEVVLGKDIEVRESAGKGMGVFARRTIDAGELVASYSGMIRTTEDANRARVYGRTTNAYAINLEVDDDGNGWVVDGEDPERSAWPRYINHSVRRANCEAARATAFGICYCIYFRARRPIAEGEEVLWDYGGGYWDMRVGRWNARRLMIDYL